MNDTIQSKKTFATAINAEKACKRQGKNFVKAHQLPSGRFCYVFTVTYL